MGKKVLYISYDGMTDPLGQSQVIPYLKGLAAYGHAISIVSAEKPLGFSAQGDSTQNEMQEAKLSWHPVTFSNKIPGWSAWRNYRRLVSMTKKICRSNHFEIVHCRSYIPAMIGLKLKKKIGCKFIFDMRGFWPDERAEGGLWKLNNPLFRFAYNFFKRCERKLLQQSDMIISLTENGKREILNRKDIQLSSEHISVIPCCADLDFFSVERITRETQEMWRQKLSIQESDIILSYSGSLGTWYLLAEMLDFFKSALKRNSSAKFLFITREPKEKILSSAAQKQIPRDKIIIVSALREEMPVLLSLSNVSVFFIRNSFSKKASSPTKMGELMALGIPIICNSGVGDVDEIIQSSGAGIIVRNFNEDEMDRAALEIERLISIPKEKIRRGAENFFSLQYGIEKYHRIYSTL